GIEKEVQEIRAKAQQESRKKVAEIIEKAKQAAESERVSILNDAQRQIKIYEELYEKNLDKAVDFVVQQLIGK
ncbi:hypothetical protein DRQ00_09585, partial [candidate division KSB1 bacterium]